MKRSTIFKKAIVTTALILSVFILVFGCDNPIETPKNTNVGSTEVISITINGDTYLKEASKKEFNIQKGTTWAVIKKRDEIKNVEFEASYQLSKWLLNGETGSELTDNVKFTEKTILYAKSESIPENSAYVSWEIADNKGGSLKAEYVEKGIKKTLPMGGKKIPVGTKIAFTALPDKENYYEVESWNAGGLSVSSDKLTADLSVHNKNGIKVTLKFIKEKADLNLKAEANGTLQAKWTAGSEPVTKTIDENTHETISIEKGTTVELNAIPKPGYEFANWTKIPNPKTNPNIITVTENIEISAKFKKIIPVPKYIKLNGYTVDLTDWKVSVPNSLKAINQAEGKFTAGAAEITPEIQIENGPVSLTEGVETKVILKVIAVDGQYGEWKQTIKVKCLSPSDLPDLILKSLKVHEEAADLTSMSVSVPNDKETITSANIKAVFFRFSEEIQNIQVTQDPVSINLTVGEPASITLSVAEKSGEGGYKAWTQTLSVTRKKLPVTGVELSAATLDLEVGEQHKLTATVQPSNATNQNVEWRSDNNAAASVEQNGTVTAKGPGTAKITVKTLDGNFEKTCTVKVVQKFTVNFAVEGNGGSLEVKAGENEVTNSSKLQADTLLKFTAIPEEGFEILNWEGISASPANAATIQHKLTENLNVKVKFKKKTYTVIFEANGGNPEPEKQTISHGDKLTEPSSITKAGNDLEGWYTDDKFTSKWNFETDKVTDNIRLYAKWEKKKITVKFDTDKITAFLNRLGSELGNDDKVFIGDKIYLSAFPLEEGKKPSWIINGKPSSSIKPYASPVGFPHLYEYTVKEEDADNRIIRFDYTPAMAEKLTIDYDNSVKRIFRPENGMPEINKGSQVDEGIIIVIEAKFDEGMIIDQCLVNGHPVSGEIMMGLFGYKISTADADSNKMLNFSCTPKTPSTGTVHWDNEKSTMTCIKNNQHGNGTSITSGDQVQEGDMLSFTANPTDGQIVDEWTVNGKKVSNHSGDGPNRFWLNVKPEHLTSGTLTISYTTKGAATGSIKFENPMTCIKNNQHGNGTSITSGDQVQEGDRLNFYVNLPQGKVVGKWMVNGTQISNGSGGEYHQFWLTVQAKHFKDNILNISYTLIPAAQTKVNFDGNIRCSVNRNGTNINVESDKTIVYEGESLDFKALGMTDSAVKSWKINDKKPQGWNGQENTWFNVTVMKFYISQSSGGPIMVSCELKEGLKSSALGFDSDKIKCLQNSYSNSYELNSGLRVYADVRLEFNALLSDSEQVKSWKINGIEQENSGHKNFSYMVQESDLNGDHFTVEIVLK